jgi:hypothetical protein
MPGEVHEKYRDRSSVEMSGPRGKPFQIDDARQRLIDELDRGRGAERGERVDIQPGIRRRSGAAIRIADTARGAKARAPSACATARAAIPQSRRCPSRCILRPARSAGIAAPGAARSGSNPTTGSMSTTWSRCAGRMAAVALILASPTSPTRLLAKSRPSVVF